MIQTPEPNTSRGLAFCFSSHCTRPDSPLWQAKCNSLCGLLGKPNRNVWVTYGNLPIQIKRETHFRSIHELGFMGSAVVKSFAKNHYQKTKSSQYANCKRETFSLQHCKKVAVHGINELAAVLLKLALHMSRLRLVDTMAPAPSQTFPQQPLLQQWLNDWKTFELCCNLCLEISWKQSDISKRKQRTKVSTESFLIFQGRQVLQDVTSRETDNQLHPTVPTLVWFRIFHTFFHQTLPLKTNRDPLSSSN